MARVKIWGAAVLVAAVAIAAAYLPPRGGVQARRSAFFVTQIPAATPARRRAQALAEEWRTADGALRLLERRAALRALASLRPDAHEPMVDLIGVHPVPPAAATMVRAALDTAWQELGLGETKVRVAIVLDLGGAPPSGRPAEPRDGPVYLEPDSTDRTTCVALVPTGPSWRRVILGEAQGHQPARARFVPWLRGSLGPCAFYAAYGTPSPSVRQWLTAHRWDFGLALHPDSGSTGVVPPMEQLGDPRTSWDWQMVYRNPPSTVACLAGRIAGCRAAVLEGSGDARDGSGLRIVRVDRRWWRSQRLRPGARYLSDVARDVGLERFQRFWSTSLPVDTALAAALKEPVGEWTERWQRRFVPRLRLGAAAPVGAYTFAVALAALVLFGAAITAQRRQVR